DGDTIRYFHRRFDPRQVLDRVKIIALEFPPKDWAGHHRGVEHIRQADIDAICRCAIHFWWYVKAILGLAEQGILLGLFDGWFGVEFDPSGSGGHGSVVHLAP